MEISQLCGEFNLRDPIDIVYKTGTEVVVNKKSEIHHQFWSQLGVSLLVCEVTSSQWQSPSMIFRTMSIDLEVNWTGIKPPGICQFADIDRGYGSPLCFGDSHNKRDIILLSVLEYFVVTNVSMDNGYIGHHHQYQ